MIVQRRVYYKRKGICENNRGVENVTVWYVGKIVAIGGMVGDTFNQGTRKSLEGL